jgi:hypothetical protein
MNIPQVLVDEIWQTWRSTGADLSVDDNSSAVDYVIDMTTFSDEAEAAISALEDEHGYAAVLLALAAHPQLQLV